MKKTFEQLYEMQLNFQRFFMQQQGITDFSALSVDQRTHFTKEYVLAAIQELSEVLDETPWKTHVLRQKPIDEQNLLFEIIDVLKYVLNIAIMNGYTHEEIENAFESKTRLVEFKFKQELALSKLKENKGEIIILDIDGVLNNYPLGFLKFVQNEMNTSESFANAKAPKDTLELFDMKQRVPQLYQAFKHSYRSSHGERDWPVPKNKEAFDILKSKATIVLLSARPVHLYKNMYEDTLAWLKTHGFDFDFIFFSDKKEQFIIDNLEDLDVLVVADDLPKNTQKLRNYFATILIENDELHPQNKSTLNLMAVAEMLGYLDDNTLEKL